MTHVQKMLIVATVLTSLAAPAALAGDGGLRSTVRAVAGYDGEATADSDAAEVKKICKESGDTGTRLRKRRICKTPAEWDASNRAARDNADAFDRATEKLRAPDPP